jgi:hypothetical protein
MVYLLLNKQRQYKTAWNHLIEAAKITKFISSLGLNSLPVMPPEQKAGIPELSPSVMNALSRLFAAESEMVAVEKGLQEKSAGLTVIKIASIYKDVINRLDEAANFLEDSLKTLTPEAQGKFKKYYITYCKGMRTFYEVCR